jgi:hypothetical protein
MAMSRRIFRSACRSDTVRCGRISNTSTAPSAISLRPRRGSRNRATYHNRFSRRSAPSICAVATSISACFPVVAALAAKVSSHKQNVLHPQSFRVTLQPHRAVRFWGRNASLVGPATTDATNINF